jgi:hypothetical protein
MSKLEFEQNDANTPDNLFIKLYVNDFSSYSKPLQYAINHFLIILCDILGAKTDINYHACTGSSEGISYINLVNYNEKFKSVDELASTRLNNLVKYLEKIDLLKQQTYVMKTVNTLLAHGINLNLLVNASVVNRMTHKVFQGPIPIHIPHPINFKRITVKRIKTIDNSTLTLIDDKCSTGCYSLFVNLSVPFSEMNMSYNALHLYEHLMMRCFKGLSQQQLSEINGCTYPNGLCYVYTIHQSIESLKQYLNLTLQTLFEARDETYWQKSKQENDIVLETKRTISETRMSRSLTDFGRSDLHAYSNGYDRNIFKYWSNKPFDIVIIGANIANVKLNETTLNKWCKEYPLHNVRRPNGVRYNEIPISVLRNKEMDNAFIQKASADEIKKLFLDPVKNTKLNVRTLLPKDMTDYGPYGYLYGVDCKLINLQESLQTYNTPITPMVFLNNMFTEQELETMLNKANLPTNAMSYTKRSYFW